MEALRQQGLIKFFDLTGDDWFMHYMSLLQYDTAWKLIAEGAYDLAHRNKHGNTPLHFAVHDYEMTRKLVILGADVKARNNDGDTALDVALRYNTTDAVVQLLYAMGCPYDLDRERTYSAHTTEWRIVFLRMTGNYVPVSVPPPAIYFKPEVDPKIRLNELAAFSRSCATLANYCQFILVNAKIREALEAEIKNKK